MPREVFVAGQILTAAEMNSVSDQTVMVFAGTAARGSAIPTPTEGMVTYLSDVNQVQAYTGSAFQAVGAILQVVSTTKTDTFTTTSTTFTDITGLTATITPSSTSSKIMIFATVSSASTSGTVSTAMRLVRDSTAIAVGATAGSRTSVSSDGMSDNGSSQQTILATDFLDSPSTTSAVIYKIQLRANTANTIAVNRSVTDSDAATFARSVSTITLMEVAG